MTGKGDKRRPGTGYGEGFDRAFGKPDPARNKFRQTADRVDENINDALEIDAEIEKDEPDD